MVEGQRENSVLGYADGGVAVDGGCKDGGW